MFGQLDAHADQTLITLSLKIESRNALPAEESHQKAQKEQLRLYLLWILA